MSPLGRFGQCLSYTCSPQRLVSQRQINALGKSCIRQSKGQVETYNRGMGSVRGKCEIRGVGWWRWGTGGGRKRERRRENRKREERVGGIKRKIFRVLCQKGERRHWALGEEKGERSRGLFLCPPPYNPLDDLWVVLSSSKALNYFGTKGNEIPDAIDPP